MSTVTMSSCWIMLGAHNRIIEAFSTQFGPSRQSGAVGMGTLSRLLRAETWYRLSRSLHCVYRLILTSETKVLRCMVIKLKLRHDR